MTHICVSKLTIIGSDNGLSPDRRRAIIWTNAGLLLIGPLGRNFNEISIEIHKFSFKTIHLKMSSGKWRPSCLGLNVLKCVRAFHYLPKFSILASMFVWRFVCPSVCLSAWTLWTRYRSHRLTNHHQTWRKYGPLVRTEAYCFSRSKVK